MKTEEIIGLLGMLFGIVILAYLLEANHIQILCLAGIAIVVYYIAIAKNIHVTIGGSIFILALLIYLLSLLKQPTLNFSLNVNIPIVQLVILFIIIFCIALAYGLILRK